MKNTLAKAPSKELADLGYSNDNGGHYLSADKDLLFTLRRDYLLDNLFVSADFREVLELDDLSIYVITGLGGSLICLGSKMWDLPNRMSADKDGEVILSSGNDEPFFSPSVNFDDGYWEDHDDECFTAGFIPIDEEGYRVINGSHHRWSSCVCIPNVTRYNPGEETVKMIVEKLNIKTEA